MVFSAVNLRRLDNLRYGGRKTKCLPADKRDRQAGVGGFLIVGLEVDLRHKLTTARASAGARGNPEVIHWGSGACRRADRNATEAEIRTVEEVEELCPKFKIDGFRNPCPLDESHAVIVQIGIS